MKGGLYKVAEIISVSIDRKQKEFLEAMKLSPSAILQRSINELMERNEVSPEFVKGLQKSISFLQETIQKQGTFIDKNGLMQEYLHFEG